MAPAAQTGFRPGTIIFSSLSVPLLLLLGVFGDGNAASLPSMDERCGVGWRRNDAKKKPAAFGVNLGNWLNMEGWMMDDPAHLYGTSRWKNPAEWQILNRHVRLYMEKKLGKENPDDAALKFMHAHWTNFIPIALLDDLAKEGVNMVRIPVGYWLWNEYTDEERHTRRNKGLRFPPEPGEPSPVGEPPLWYSKEGFAVGGLRVLEDMLPYFYERCIRVKLDLHALPGVHQEGAGHAGYHIPATAVKSGVRAPAFHNSGRASLHLKDPSKTAYDLDWPRVTDPNLWMNNQRWWRKNPFLKQDVVQRMDLQLVGNRQKIHPPYGTWFAYTKVITVRIFKWINNVNKHFPQLIAAYEPLNEQLRGGKVRGHLLNHYYPMVRWLAGVVKLDPYVDLVLHYWQDEISWNMQPWMKGFAANHRAALTDVHTYINFGVLTDPSQMLDKPEKMAFFQKGTTLHGEWSVSRWKAGLNCGKGNKASRLNFARNLWRKYMQFFVNTKAQAHFYWNARMGDDGTFKLRECSSSSYYNGKNTPANASASAGPADVAAGDYTHDRFCLVRQHGVSRKYWESGGPQLNTGQWCWSLARMIHEGIVGNQKKASTSSSSSSSSLLSLGNQGARNPDQPSRMQTTAFGTSLLSRGANRGARKNPDHQSSRMQATGSSSLLSRLQARRVRQVRVVSSGGRSPLPAAPPESFLSRSARRTSTQTETGPLPRPTSPTPLRAELEKKYQLEFPQFPSPEKEITDIRLPRRDKGTWFVPKAAATVAPQAAVAAPVMGVGVASGLQEEVARAQSIVPEQESEDDSICC